MYSVTSFLCYEDAAVVSVVAGDSVVSVGTVSEATAGSVGVSGLTSALRSLEGAVTVTLESGMETEAAAAEGSVTADGVKATPCGRRGRWEGSTVGRVGRGARPGRVGRGARPGRFKGGSGPSGGKAEWEEQQLSDPIYKSLSANHQI